MVDWKLIAWEAKYYLWYRKLILVPVFIALPVLAWLHIHRAVVSPQPQPLIAYVYPRIKGGGDILINSTINPQYFGYEAPWTAVLEAKPREKWVFAYWIINHSKVMDNPLAITIKGNTTATAVFAKALCKLVFSSNVPSTALINGSKVKLPFEKEYPCNSTVLVEQLPLEGYKPLNGSMTLKVRGDLTLALLYEKLCKVVVEPKNVTVYVNGTPVSETYSAYVDCGSLLTLEGNCTYLNEMYDLCVVGWHMSYAWPNATLPEEVDSPCAVLIVGGDVRAIPVLEKVLRTPPPIEGEVLLASGTLVKVRVLPDKSLIVPFTGIYQYLGDGWYEVRDERGGGVIYITLSPNWKKVIIEGWSEWSGTCAGPVLEFGIVVPAKEGGFREAGISLCPCKQFRVEFNPKIYDYDPHLSDEEFNRLFREALEYEGNCDDCLPMYGGTIYPFKDPSKVTEEGLEAGWLYVNFGCIVSRFRVIVYV